MGPILGPTQEKNLGSGSSGGNSGWTSILEQGDGSASSVNQPTPTNSTQTGSSSETGDNVIPPSPGEPIKGLLCEMMESSMRFRIVRLEQDNSPYLLDKARGNYWAQIRHELDHLSSQRFTLLEFENRDLRIRAFLLI